MPLLRRTLQLLLEPAARLDRKLHRLLSPLVGPSDQPLFGDRCIEYAFVINALLPLERALPVLDVGSAGSPLTTIIRTLGFEHVDGIDLLASPVRFNGVTFYEGDFLQTSQLRAGYGAIVFCSSIEHFGLAGRYGSPAYEEGDLHALRRAEDLLLPRGLLVLTVPYGREATIAPYHRVYNRTSKLLQHACTSLVLEREEYYWRQEGAWRRCSEPEARSVEPGADRYALGLFALVKGKPK